MREPALFEDTPLERLSAGPHAIRPFSVLRSDLGPWRERRRAWHELGIDSRAGRDHVTTFSGGADPVSQKLISYNGGLSTFDPVLAEVSYEWYCRQGGSILDPFAGGSVRGLVAANAGFRYHGIDLSPEQIDANEVQAADWAQRDLLAAEPTWQIGDSADILPTLPDGAFDYVFTCPPYHNLERYSDHPADLSAMRWKDFAPAYEQIIAESVRCLAEDRFSTWVVGEVRNYAGMVRGLVPLTIAAHERAGARLYNDSVLLNTIGTAAMRLPQQWRAARKMGRIHQYVLTFVKGDPKRATALLPGPTGGDTC